jgi:hypothetical protein
MRNLFFSVMWWRRKKRHNVPIPTLVPRSLSFPCSIGKRHVGLLRHRAEDVCRLSLDALRPAITTLLHRKQLRSAPWAVV